MLLHASAAALLLLILLPLVVVVQGRTTDLSVEFDESLNNPGAAQIAVTASNFSEIRTALVLEHGTIVADYVREDVDPTAPFQVWSTTKSWMSLLIGIMVEDNLIDLNETLGEIFTDDAVWNNVNETERAFKQNVTIWEMLTMSSGLVDPNPYDRSRNITQGGNGGGASLPESLEFPALGERGIFSYLGISNIMSYVIFEKTSMSPREYATTKVFASLGIDNSTIDWWQNADGMEYSYHGLELNARQMAKFGQLYLQNGQSAPGTSLVSSDWVSDSSSPQVDAMVLNPVTNQSLTAQYGYLIWLFNGTSIGVPTIGDFYCAIGFGGQDICVSPELDRVSVQQRDYEDAMGNLIIAAVAFDPNVSFESNSTTDASTTSGGGMWLHYYPSSIVGLCMLPLIVSFLY